MKDRAAGGENATLLSPQERDGLIPTHLTLHSELNELEQLNILKADAWAFSRRHNLFAEPFARGLHRRMFGNVWRWAGTYRASNKNLGIDYWRAPTALRGVLDDARYWAQHKSFTPDEAAVRFHHALVCVHPFPNGNGRWSRLMADLLAHRLGRPRFTWGRSALRAADETRAAYIRALKTADAHDIAALVEFARS